MRAMRRRLPVRPRPQSWCPSGRASWSPTPTGAPPPAPLRSAAWHVTGGVLQTCLAPCASRILHLSSWGGCLLRLPVWPLHAVLALVLS
jgi:hypothetical protein